MIDEKEMMIEDFDTLCDNFIASEAGQKILDQGHQNYCEGDRQCHNPYDEETKEYWAWDAGWTAAQEHYE